MTHHLSWPYSGRRPFPASTKRPCLRVAILPQALSPNQPSVIALLAAAGWLAGSEQGGQGAVDVGVGEAEAGGIEHTGPDPRAGQRSLSGEVTQSEPQGKPGYDESRRTMYPPEPGRW